MICSMSYFSHVIPPHPKKPCRTLLYIFYARGSSTNGWASTRKALFWVMLTKGTTKQAFHADCWAQPGRSGKKCTIKALGLKIYSGQHLESGLIANRQPVQFAQEQCQAGASRLHQTLVYSPIIDWKILQIKDNLALRIMLCVQ